MYTIRPSPTQACAAAHIGQCSPEVSSASTVPSPATSTDPKGSSPASSASVASSTQRRR